MTKIFLNNPSTGTSLRELRNIVERVTEEEVPPPKFVRFLVEPPIELNINDVYAFLDSPENQIDFLEYPDEELTIDELNKRPAIIAYSQSEPERKKEDVIVIGVGDVIIIISPCWITIDHPEKGFIFINICQ